jgi:hypothetical protein
MRGIKHQLPLTWRGKFAYLCHVNCLVCSFVSSSAEANAGGNVGLTYPSKKFGDRNTTARHAPAHHIPEYTPRRHP